MPDTGSDTYPSHGHDCHDSEGTILRRSDRRAYLALPTVLVGAALLIYTQSTANDCGTDHFLPDSLFWWAVIVGSALVGLAAYLALDFLTRGSEVAVVLGGLLALVLGLGSFVLVFIGDGC